MPMLRYVYALALALWLGGMVVLGAIVAPAAFQVLPIESPDSGRALAGAVFGAVLARWHRLAYAAGAVMLVALAVMALLGPRPVSLAIRMAIVATMLGVAIYSGVIVLGEVDGIQKELATLSSAPVLPSQLSAADPRRIRFDALHVLSTRLMMFNIAGALVLLVWEARE
jgi:hypothetical protein